MSTLTDKEKNTNFSPFLILSVVLVVFFATNVKTREIVLYFAIFSIVTIIHLMGFVVSGLLAGIKIDQVQIFFGKSLATIKLKSLLFKLGVIPTGGFVKFSGMDTEDDCKEGFCLLPLIWRVVIVASGVLALLVTSCVILGSSKALSSFISGFAQGVRGGLSPLSYGQFLLERLSKIYSEHGFIYALGIVATKTAAFNLLPIPSSNGGQIVLDLLRIRKNKDRLRWQLIGFFLALILNIGWLIAVSKFVLKQLG